VEALELANQFAGVYDDIVRVARTQLPRMPGKVGMRDYDPYDILWPGKAALNVV